MREIAAELAVPVTTRYSYVANWMGRVAPEQVADTFAADAWVGAKAFLDSLETLPGQRLVPSDGFLC